MVQPGCHLLIVTDKGMGKRTPIEEFPLQGRAGGGVKAITLTDRSGPVVVARMVHPEDDLVVICDKGLVIRMFVEDISAVAPPGAGRGGDEYARQRQRRLPRPHPPRRRPRRADSGRPGQLLQTAPPTPATPGTNGDR